MKHTTLLFLLRDEQVLLAMKERGFGVNRWNGVGGKIEPGEAIEAAAIRKCQEEIGVKPRQLGKVAHHTFWLAPLADHNKLTTHTFIARDWEGEPIETEEMAPRWFQPDKIPYDSMWDDDRHWLPHILAGKKLVCEFTFDNNDLVIDQNIKFVSAKHKLLS